MRIVSKLLSGAFILGLAACGGEAMQQAMKEGLNSGSALERIAAEGSMLASSEQITVNRSKAQIVGSLEEFSERCLNMTVQYGRFPGDAAVQNEYVPMMTNEDGTTRHVLFRRAGGHSVVHLSDVSKQFNAASSTRLQPTGSGSTLVTITTTLGQGNYNEAVKQAVTGQGILCPALN